MESNFTPAGRTSKSGTRGADDRTNLADWRAGYANKVKRAEKAMKLVRRGHRVFIGSGYGEPQYLVRALEQVAVQSADRGIHQITIFFDQPAQQCFTHPADF